MQTELPETLLLVPWVDGPGNLLVQKFALKRVLFSRQLARFAWLRSTVWTLNS